MNCKNCEKQLLEEDNYCNDCGARVIEQRLTNRFFISEIKENFFSIDSNKPLRTFIDMFKKPENVTTGYINGVRKKYINPFGYFTIAVTLTTFFYFIAYRFFPETMEFSFSFTGEMSAEEKNAASKSVSSIMEYQSLIYFIFIPFFAIITWILFIKERRYNFAEHLVLNMYGYSQVSIFVIIIYFLTLGFKSIFKYVMIISIILQIVYYAYLLKRVFKLSMLQIILKSLLFIPLGFFFYTIVSLGIGALFVLLGIIDLQDFIPPPKETKDAVSYIASSVINWTS